MVKAHADLQVVGADGLQIASGVGAAVSFLPTASEAAYANAGRCDVSVMERTHQHAADGVGTQVWNLPLELHSS